MCEKYRNTIGSDPAKSFNCSKRKGFFDKMKKDKRTSLLQARGFLQNLNVDQGGDSQNFLQKFVIFCITLKSFYRVVIHRK